MSLANQKGGEMKPWQEKPRCVRCGGRNVARDGKGWKCRNPSCKLYFTVSHSLELGPLVEKRRAVALKHQFHYRG